LLDISETDELCAIEQDSSYITIGSAAKISEILESDLVSESLPLLGKVLLTLGSTQIRNRATLGGNLVNASPAADSAIPLLLYEASANIAGPYGDRRIPVEDLIVGPGKTALRSGEVVKSLSIPLPKTEFKEFFHKVGRRKAMIIAIASLGALTYVQEGMIREIRLAAGSVAPRPIRLRVLEEELTGSVITGKLVKRAREIAVKSVSPIDDVRASASYRREVIGELVARVLSMLAD
jgi:CO/xanthine dehydrogenase FAD-binding subunit